MNTCLVSGSDRERDSDSDVREVPQRQDVASNVAVEASEERGSASLSSS